jgi:hypothetical protein
VALDQIGRRQVKTIEHDEIADRPDEKPPCTYKTVLIWLKWPDSRSDKHKLWNLAAHNNRSI